MRVKIGSVRLGFLSEARGRGPEAAAVGGQVPRTGIARPEGWSCGVVSGLC
jgi:hypothetical protein